MTIERLDAKECLAEADAFAAMLIEAVEEGAGLGFLAPVDPREALAYVEDVAREVAQGRRVLLVARVDGEVAGSAQLDLCQRPNGLHRAEVQKVMVARRFRRRGLGRALMEALDVAAIEEGRSTLVLDTFADQEARALYEACGWTHAGDIPAFASKNDGTLGATSLYYKRLPTGP